MEYQRSAPVLAFSVDGLPIAQGSKSFRGVSKSGRAIMTESAKGLKPWRAVIQQAIGTAIAGAGCSSVPMGGFPLLGPLAIDLVFTMPKPKSAPKTRLTWPIVRPDADKLERAFLDAGTIGGLWQDDSQVIDIHGYKVYPLETPRALRAPGVYAEVFTIGAVPAEPGEQLLIGIAP